jgi:hypothetical protein
MESVPPRIELEVDWLGDNVNTSGTRPGNHGWLAASPAISRIALCTCRRTLF